MSENIPHWLTKQASLSPHATALELEDGSRFTFYELMEQSQAFARKLANQGVVEGAKVGIFSTNCKGMVIAIHALSYLHAVAVLFNVRLTKKELAFQIEDADVAQILVKDDLEDHLRDMNLSTKVTPYSFVTKTEETSHQLASEIDLEDAFTIMYTSGTTGNPKGVVHTYGNHWWSATGSALNIGIHADDKWLAALPLFHIGGLSLLLKSVIYGMPVYLMEKFNVQKVHYAIMKCNVTIASVVTVMLQQLVDFLGEGEYPKAFRCMLLGGGPAPKGLLELSKAKQIPVFQSYGMTETSSQIVTLSPNDALRKLGSAGKPLFPAQLTIMDADQGGVGEIVVKGPMVTRGYYKNQYATTKALKEGWLSTGDLGRLDGEGFLYVVERRNDLIISGGENIYPSEIESVLSSMNGVKEVGVTGIEDAKWGQVPAAFIILDGPPISEAAIRQYAAENVAAFKIPKQIYFINELPRNASNKLLRNELYKLIP
ncbi:o-succinylbenzoate--CoA ligase [Virgibacillus phasianinus]|uniref:2-succinylbenzoate--CoA ligase n=1 Tax=Virgibacillus phasianinus TaxID=2017483 RepID=A0A220U588_9BACI|nr:o-succinylbenzoate--CoA ligase [Virgibacillus phasianinus]ASK62893.1 o-succinylbenzoate--CoA ligase [Virgibacillus phasianinus]